MTMKNAAKHVDIDVILKYRRAGIVAFLVLTLFFAFQLKGLNLVSDPMEPMYLSEHEFLQGMHDIDDMVPTLRMLVCILDLEQGDVYNTETIKKIDEISKGLTAIEGVLPGGIVSLSKGMDHYNNTADGLSIEPILGYAWPTTADEFAKLKRKVAINPMGPGKYVAYDSTAVMITANLTNIQQDARTAYNQLSEKDRGSFEKYEAQRVAAFNAGLLKGLRDLRSRIDDDNHHLYFMGQEVLTAQMTEMGKRDIPIAAVAMIVIILALLWVWFRRIAGVIVPLLCLGLSMVWVLGGCAMLGIELHPMALLFPLVLGLVSMGYSAMIMAEYYRLFKETGDKNASISGAFSRTSLIAAMVILGLVSAVMCLVPVPMFQGMGYAGIIWMVGGFGFIVLGLPLMISLFPEPKEANGQVEPETGARSGSSHAWILLGFALVIGLGCFSATKLNVGDNVPGYDYISEGHPWAECFSIFSEKFMGPRQLLVYVEADAPGGLLEPEAMNAIGAFSRFLRNEGGATDSIGFDMMVCMTRGMLMDANPKWQTVPVTRDKIFGMSGMVMEEGGAEAFMGPKYTRAVISPFFPKQDTAAINAYASSMQTYIDTHPYEHCRFSLGGGLLGMTKVLNDTTRHVYPVIIAASFLVLLVLGAMVSGSLITGVLVAIPVAAAQALLWIMMLVFQMKIGLPMVGVAPVALGFGAMFGLYACTGGSSVSRGTLAWTGGLVFAASLPWFFIGMRFQGSMMMFFGMMVVFETLCALGFMPVWKSWSDIHSNKNNGGIYG